MTSGDVDVTNLSSRCQKVVDDVNAGRLSSEEGLQKFPTSNQGVGSSGPTQNNGGTTLEGLDDAQREEYRRKRTEILGEGGRDRSGGEDTGGDEGRRRIEGSDPLSGLANPGAGKETQYGDTGILAQRLNGIQGLVHVDTGSGRVLLEPLHHSIRKLILKDEYVSFEKHLAGIDPEYDHKDEGQDFGGGYA
ncbi:hypothetical protein EV360DRAFT_85972 [Lentinula raphanica]|nr:hypothetical protein EV360DRAFT_85972 [Lentinula raphanica]